MDARIVSYPIVIEIPGEAQPAGSKTSRVIYKKNAYGKLVPVVKNGRIQTATYDANASKAGPWKAQVALFARTRYVAPPLTGPLRVELIFYRKRPQGHFGTGRNAGVIKDSAPAYPESRPDAIKLARAVEDALTGIVWMDDAQIVDEFIGKRYGNPRCEIRVWPAEVATIGDMIADDVVELPGPTEQFEQLSLIAA